MKNKKVVLTGVLIFFAYAGLKLIQAPTVALPSPGSSVSMEGTTMGTTYEVQISGVQMGIAEKTVLQAKVDQELLAVNQAMSTYMPESEISRFNRMDSGETFPVGVRFRDVLVRSFEIFRQTNGTFDPTLGPLIDLWGFGAKGPQGEGPSEAEIQTVLQRGGMERIALSEEGLRKREEGIEINLSAIAKGYGVDRVAELLREQGFENIYVEIGGELYCQGVNAQGVPWRIGIEMPAMETPQTALKVLSLQNRGLATSGDYRNYVVDESGLRHHILDPRTGRPAKHTLASVSVLAADCMTADAVATALFVMGTGEGLKWVEAQEGLEALFIDREGDGYKITATDGFRAGLIAVP